MCADARRADFKALLELLLGAAAGWADGEDVEDKASPLRRAAILHNHQRYVDHIPAYAELASQRGLAQKASIEEITHELMFTTDLFKSYDERWLEERCYDRLTEWLGTVFSGRPVVEARLASLEEWRRTLAAQRVYVTFSSGTSGKPSFVPRDVATLRALSGNGWYYAHALPTMRMMERSEFDCLVLGPRATGTGLQAASTGVARAASRSHFLFDDAPGVSRDAGGTFDAAASRDSAYARAWRFLASSASDGRPVVVFATPMELYKACSWLEREGLAFELPEGSVVMTGGGWKSTGPPLAGHEDLARSVHDRLGVAADHFVDTYSTAEMNFFCMRCAHGRYHVPPVVEVVLLDDTLTPVEERVGYGLIGFLDPFAACYPGFLVTGDQGHIELSRCACGLSGWAIEGEIVRSPEFGQKGCAGVLEALTV